MGGPYEMEDDDYVNYPLGRSRYSQVVSAQSHAFWDGVLGYGVREDNLRARLSSCGD